MSSLPAFLLAALLSLGDLKAGPPALPPPPEPLRPGFEAIDEGELRSWVGFLASPELEGRETGRSGYDVAARFCATLFARYGLKPGGDAGSYFQGFDVVQTQPDAAASFLEIEDGQGRERFPLEGNLAPASPVEVDWSGPWVFAGRGRGAESDSPDDFRGLPVAESVVMVVPPIEQKRGEAKGAIAAGAKRILVVSDERVKGRAGLRQVERPAFDPEPPAPQGPQVVYVSRPIAERVLKARGVDAAMLGKAADRLPHFALDGLKARLVVKRKTSFLKTRNVVGILEGADPALRAEAVSIGAHLDHVGVHDGKVYPGADDDASGSSGVLALAKAFSTNPRRPARTMVFCLFTGEEKGLWGSRYFVEHPAVPLARITAHLQMDMIGRDEEHPGKEKAEENRNSVHVVGSKRRSFDLDREVQDANRFLALDFEYDEEDVYSRSDQLHFGERGVPVAFFFSGFHPDYHAPTDTPDRIDYPKMTRIVRLVFVTAYDLAERREPLRKFSRI